jgi:tubulin polyglutamylase TTLL6/13
MARFCTKDYVRPNENNIDNMYMHLTNSAINKNNMGYKLENRKSMPTLVNGLKPYLSEHDRSSKRLFSSVIKTLSNTHNAEKMLDL